MIRGAVIDPSGRYRYSLTRRWASGDSVLFILLNPSIADDKVDDATIRRCIGFARAWGYGALEVVNLFAYRATAPAELQVVEDPIGPENDVTLEDAQGRNRQVVVAWGVGGALQDRDQIIMRRLWVYPKCLGTTKGGFPRHPVRLGRAAKLVYYCGDRYR